MCCSVCCSLRVTSHIYESCYDCNNLSVCCSVVQCIAVYCSVLQCVAVCCSVLQCGAVHCSALQCVAVCCSMLQYVAVCCSMLQRQHVHGSRYMICFCTLYNLFFLRAVAVLTATNSLSYTRKKKNDVTHVHVTRLIHTCDTIH